MLGPGDPASCLCLGRAVLTTIFAVQFSIQGALSLIEEGNNKAVSNSVCSQVVTYPMIALVPDQFLIVELNQFQQQRGCVTSTRQDSIVSAKPLSSQKCI